jgi:hypothetical protein
MIKSTPYYVDVELLDNASAEFSPGKESINQPTGRFFYDPWVIKPEYSGTVWDQILSTLKTPIGEARIIKLESSTNYAAHSDIDDRYHLNLTGEDCYLIDLEHQKMYPVAADGIWYDMNAGVLHTACNFGRTARTQLVVRKLLIERHIIKPVRVVISVGGSSLDDSRFVFDRVISPWLNKTNKQGQINDFTYENQQIKFIVDGSLLAELDILLKTTDFNLEII